MPGNLILEKQNEKTKEFDIVVMLKESEKEKDVWLWNC